jgi:hypothetical protein
MILMTSDVASGNFVFSGNERSGRHQSRSFGIVIGSGVIREVVIGIRKAEKIVAGREEWIPNA